MYITHPNIDTTTSVFEVLNKIVNVQIEECRGQTITLLNTEFGREIFSKETVYIYLRFTIIIHVSQALIYFASDTTT